MVLGWGAVSSCGLGAREVGWGQPLGASFRLPGPQAAHRPLQHLASHLSPYSEDSFMVQDYAQETAALKLKDTCSLEEKL